MPDLAKIDWKAYISLTQGWPKNPKPDKSKIKKIKNPTQGQKNWPNPPLVGMYVPKLKEGGWWKKDQTKKWGLYITSHHLNHPFLVIFIVGSFRYLLLHLHFFRNIMCPRAKRVNKNENSFQCSDSSRISKVKRGRGKWHLEWVITYS